MLAGQNFFPFRVLGFLLTIIGLVSMIDAAQTTTSVDKDRTTFQQRDAAIREALVSISSGKLPPNDDRLIDLIAENVREAAFNANEPTAGIEAAARQAQEAVSEVTAAYTAVIFKSSSVAEAGNLFNRYENAVNRIVDFAKSGNFVVGYDPQQISTE